MTCSHYQAEKRRKLLKARFGVTLTLDYEMPPSGSHIYPTYLAPIIRRPAERDSGDEAVPDFDGSETLAAVAVEIWADPRRRENDLGAAAAVWLQPIEANAG